MKVSGFVNRWTLTVIFLVIVIVVGSVIISQKVGEDQPVEITLAPERQVTGEIYVGGGVNNPGYYPIFAGDTLDDIIAEAGGLKEGSGFNSVELSVCSSDDWNAPQKININTAEIWLLQALPGVGEVKAQAIIDYRNENGHFRDINELKLVPGFGDVSFDNVKDFITVND